MGIEQSLNHNFGNLAQPQEESQLEIIIWILIVLLQITILMVYTHTIKSLGSFSRAKINFDVHFEFFRAHIDVVLQDAQHVLTSLNTTDIHSSTRLITQHTADTPEKSLAREKKSTI